MKKLLYILLIACVSIGTAWGVKTFQEKAMNISIPVSGWSGPIENAKEAAKEILDNETVKETSSQDTTSLEDTSAEEAEQVAKDDRSQDASSTQALTPGVLAAYSEAIVQKTSGKIVLDFTASYCTVCRKFDQEIHQNKDLIPHGLTILQVNFDTEKDLREKYGVTYQHTFVQIDNTGKMIKKWSGSESLADVLVEIQ